MRRVNTVIGAPIERVEDLRFLRGRGQYLDDLNRPGQWHAAVVRSNVAHGRVRAVDTAAALALPGVHAVVTARDLPQPMPTIPFRRPLASILPHAQPALADDVVRYVGEPVALVLADTPGQAEDGAAAVEVDIEHLPVVADHRASARGDVLLKPGLDTNCACVFNAMVGDADKAFATATYTRRETFRVQRMTALPMETRGLLAEWDEDAQKLTVAGAAKLPFFCRRAMASMMGLPETSVDYIEYDVGGGFGARGEFYPEDFLVAFAARTFKRPVKWVEDRREHFMAIAHSRETECELEIALDRDGMITGLRGDIVVDIGAYVRPNGMTPVRNLAQFTAGPYHVPNIKLVAHAMTTNKTPSGTYRGPGRYEGCFFMDRLLDMAAKDLGLDRLDIRRKNFIAHADMPYPLPPVRPNEGTGDLSCDSGDYTSTFDRCVAEAGWRDKLKLNGKLIDGRYHGIGIACFIEGGGSGPREHARIDVEPDGSLAVYLGSSAIGQGIETIMAQIAADALEVPLGRIKIYHGSTNLLKEGVGSFGSRATVMGGSAIVVTANALIEKFKAAAGEHLGVPVDAIKVEEGVASAPDGRRVTLADVAHKKLSADGKFESSKPTYSYGTAITHVAVDPRIGSVEVLDYLVVDDVGRIINPETLHGQVLGAAVQGFGSTFTEEIAYDENGQLLVGSLADYLVPLATDYPSLRAISLDEHPSPNNPLGAKGAGEGGIIPVGGAVGNAVAAALSSFGVEPKVLPLTPSRVWQLIQDAKAEN